MSVEVQRFLSTDIPTSLRPPVPGEENEGDSQPGSLCSGSSGKSSTKNSQGTCNMATPRKSNLIMATTKMKNTIDEEAPLGFEPEGSDSITPPYTRWTESLHALLNDNDGISLFTEFLEQLQEEHYLKFWFACQGFKMRDQKVRFELSKLICKKFIKLNAQAAIKLSSSTRTSIEDSLKKGQVSVELFDHAQNEAELFIHENLYPVFLKSDIYVQYVNNGGMSEKTSDCSSPSSNGCGVVCERYLPTLVEDEELGIKSEIDEQDLVSKPPTRLTAEYLQQTSKHRLLLGHNKRQRRDDKFCHSRSKQQPINPYHVQTAPAQSTNDSERQSLSSEAISDDTIMSLTDSKIDGRPMYHRHNVKKIKRNMRRNIHVNGHIQSFPQFPCPQPPKESRQLTQEEFVRQLTEKLEQVKKDQDTRELLEARLKEVDEVDSVISEEKLFSGLETLDEDPDSILDDHCARVFTPTRSVGQTPNRPGHLTPKSKSPDQLQKPKQMCNVVPTSLMTGNTNAYIKHGKSLAKNTDNSVTCQNWEREHGPPHGYDHRSQLHVFSSHGKNNMPEQVGPYSDDYYSSKSRTENTRLQQYMFTDSRPKREKQSSKKSDISSISKTTDSGIYEGSSSLPSDGERNKAVVQWLSENETYNRPKLAQKSGKRNVHKVSENPPVHGHSQRHGNSAMKKPVVYNAARPSVGASKRGQWSSRPNHPFMQDTSMPLNTPPDAGTVLEEARRRMHVDERHRKNQDVRHSKPQVSGFSGDEQLQHMPSTRVSISKLKNNFSTNTTTSKYADSITVAYFFCNDPIPYRTTFPQRNVNLAQFKQLISRKGNYRYSFKTHSDEFDSGVVHEIISDDDSLLPHFKGKIIGKVENIDQ